MKISILEVVDSCKTEKVTVGDLISLLLYQGFEVPPELRGRDLWEIAEIREFDHKTEIKFEVEGTAEEVGAFAEKQALPDPWGGFLVFTLQYQLFGGEGKARGEAIRFRDHGNV
jgi:hypothetical protein